MASTWAAGDPPGARIAGATIHDPCAHAQRVLITTAVFGLALILPGEGWAQGFGVRAGISATPDDIHVGGHAVIRHAIGEVPNLEIVPAAVFGFGSENDVDYTTIRVDVNGRWMIPISETLAVYPLAGPGLGDLPELALTIHYTVGGRDR